MGQCENSACALDDFSELLRFGQRECHRLVQNDIKAVQHCHLGWTEMQMIRGYNGNEVHPLVFRKLSLFFDHLLISAVDSVIIKHELSTRFQ